MNFRHYPGELAALGTVALVAVVSLARGVGPDALAAHPGGPRLFQTADACMACHNNLSTPTGEDISIGTAWRATMMANSARDPYWQASVRRETLDHPTVAAEIESECATCHMPMARTEAIADGRHAGVFEHLPIGDSDEPEALLAADGVSCTMCHQMRDTLLGTPQSFNGGYQVDTAQPWLKRRVYGPFEVDAGRATIMHSSSQFRPEQGLHIQKSELCATCHTLYTSARDATGGVIGRLPEQVPFLEWKHSDYAQQKSCQTCHMPVVADSTQASGVWGLKRKDVSRHDFLGGNFLMLSMLNRYRAELHVEALPRELTSAALKTVRFLQTETARVTVGDARMVDGRLRATVTVQNLTGHKLPTAYPSRRAWLHVTVRDAAGVVVFESGAIAPSGAIAGNDNDADAAAYAPHYREITTPAQVQVYESVMGDLKGNVTTGLLSAVRYVKDNRLLPAGFDKRTAHADIAVIGQALDDANFIAGGDRVDYSVDVKGATGPFRVQAALLFQPIGFRWARNLSTQPAMETTRFTSYYDAMSSASSVVLAADSLRVP